MSGNRLTARETAAAMRGMDNVLILTHVRPDGDTIGCAAALCRALRAKLAVAENVPAESILCGNGAADLIFRLAVRIHFRGDQLFLCIFAKKFNIDIFPVPLFGAGAAVRFIERRQIGFGKFA